MNAPQVQLEDRFGLEPGKMFSEISEFQLQSGEANKEMFKELKNNTSQLWKTALVGYLYVVLLDDGWPHDTIMQASKLEEALVSYLDESLS